MRPARQAQDGQSPATGRMLLRSTDRHLVQLGTDGIVGYPQQPRQGRLERTVLAPIPRRD
jgi:hypothetical protein